MIGTVAHVSPSRQLALITPTGRDRRHDVVVSDLWFVIGDVEPPFVGQVVEFDVAKNSQGFIEAVNVRPPAAASTEGSCPSTPAS